MYEYKGKYKAFNISSEKLGDLKVTNKYYKVRNHYRNSSIKYAIYKYITKHAVSGFKIQVEEYCFHHDHLIRKYTL